MSRSPFLPLLALLLCLPLLLGAATAPIMPSTDYYVGDEAGLITRSHRESMIAWSQELEEATGAQLVVLMVGTTGAQTPDEYADAVFHGWQIGGPQGNGALLLVPADTLDCRVVVGEALAPSLDDGTLTEVLDSAMEPSFDGGNVSVGTLAGYKALAALIYRHYGMEVPEALLAQSPTTSIWSPVTIALMALILFLAVRSMRVTRRYQEKYGKRGGYKLRERKIQRKDDDAYAPRSPRQEEIARLKRIALEELAEQEAEQAGQEAQRPPDADTGDDRQDEAPDAPEDPQ